MRALGIDVSAFQGTVDWQKVADYGVSYVYVRATYGSHYEDPNFVDNVAGARAVGLLVGAYLALKVGDNPEMQALLFSRVAGSVGSFDLPPMVDFENPSPEHWGTQDMQPMVDDVVTIVRLLSAAFLVDPIVYTYKYFTESLEKRADLSVLGRYGLAMAEYSEGAVDRPSEDHSPFVPRDWLGWLFWQFSGDGGKHIPGIVPPVDHDVYNGTIEDLRIAFPKTEYAPKA